MNRIHVNLRHAFRYLARRPMFSLVAIVTLAVGIGMATAMFTLVHSVLLRPLPFPDADRLVTVTLGAATYERLEVWRTRQPVLSEVAGAC